MLEIISKEEFNRLMKTPGELRGNGPKTMALFILKKEGENGLKKIEKAMDEIGYPIKYLKINPMNFYPVGLAAVTLLIINRIFNYNDKTFQEMGANDVRFSSLTKVFLKYFISIKTLVKLAPKIWNKYHTSGKLSTSEYDEKKKYVIIKLENINLNIFHCQYLIGYFIASAKMVIPGEVTCEEIKCISRGDEYHEFLLKW